MFSLALASLARMHVNRRVRTGTSFSYREENTMEIKECYQGNDLIRVCPERLVQNEPNTLAITQNVSGRRFKW